MPALGDPRGSGVDGAEVGSMDIFDVLHLRLVWVGLPSVRNEAGETLRWTWVFSLSSPSSGNKSPPFLGVGMKL